MYCIAFLMLLILNALSSLSGFADEHTQIGVGEV
jgi:hypothetical protein